MRNLAPSALVALPHATHNLAELEHAFNARRRQVIAIVDSAALAGRVLTQPSMSWVDGPRTQPRDGRGRFLPRTWLADAELFLPADLAFFRSPLSSTEGK